MDWALGHLLVQVLWAQAQLNNIAASRVYAAEIHAPLFSTSPDASVRFWADLYGVSYYEMHETIQCESGFDPNAVGDHGHSYGVSQIYLPAHADITKKQALDPDWAVQYMASHWHTDHWSCARNLGFDSG